MRSLIRVVGSMQQKVPAQRQHCRKEEQVQPEFGGLAWWARQPLLRVASEFGSLDDRMMES
jgi:hypothetical protein